MERLISNGDIEKYIVKEVDYSGKCFKTIFEYTNNIVMDTDELSIGFEDLSGNTFESRIYLPSVRPDGLLQKNRTVWYRVLMGIPPVSFMGLGAYPKVVYYLNGLIDPDGYNSSMDNFFPKYSTCMPLSRTPLMNELLKDGPYHISDIGKWTVLDLGTTIIELFNVKIVDEISRSQRGGYKGINIAKRAINTLMRAFTGYDGGNQETLYTEEDFENLDENNSSINTEDKTKIILNHPIIETIKLIPSSPVDFCTCSTSKPLASARLKDGVKIENHKFVTSSTFPYTEWRRSIVGIQNDDPHRVVVSKSITRSMRLNLPDIPWAATDHSMKIDSVSTPGCRFTHPLNCEDGIIVSKTFANKTGAFKLYVDRITIPESMDIMMLKEPFKDTPSQKGVAKMLSGAIDLEDEFRISDITNSIIKNNDTIAIGEYTINGEIIYEEFKSDVRSTSIIISMESFKSVDDLNEERITHRTISLAYLPLEIGDKISDAHGNKSTVSAILPDEEMPVWYNNELRVLCHYIATPYIMKRLAVGAEIEDKLALIGYVKSIREECLNQVIVDSYEKFTMEYTNGLLQDENAQYTSKVKFGSKEYDNIPISMRTMFRLDNSSIDSISTKEAKLGIDILCMFTKNAHGLINELVTESNPKEHLEKSVYPLLNALSDTIPDNCGYFEINKRLDRKLLGNPTSCEQLSCMDMESTVCDDRLKTQYGIVKLGKSSIVVPPHNPLPIKYGAGKPSDVATAANRVVAEVISSRGGYKTDIPGKVSTYVNMIGNKLTGKEGAIRNLIPKFKCTVKAVASTISGNDPFTVFVPARNFFNVYNHNDKMKSKYTKPLEDGTMQALLKRDPIHYEKHLICVNVRLWNNKTIGVHPALIKLLDGDYDGDTVRLMFPTTWEGYNDLKLFIPDIDSLPKDMKNVGCCNSTKEALDGLKSNIGLSSTFQSPHEFDELKNEDVFTRLLSGETTNLDRLKAVRDFQTIKNGTANIGAQSLSFIASMDYKDKDMLRESMHIYHVLAQNTLDAKSGINVPAIKIIAAFRKGDADTIRTEMANLSIDNTECISRFIEFALECHMEGGRMKRVTNAYPVHASMSGGAGYAQANSLNRWIKSNGIGGIWEKLHEYITQEKYETNSHNLEDRKWKALFG